MKKLASLLILAAIVWSTAAQGVIVSRKARKVFVYDSFTGTDGTNLTSHTGETGATYTQQLGTDVMNIQSNRAGKDSNNTGTIALRASGQASSITYTVECVIVDIGNVNRAFGCCGWMDTAQDDMLCVRRTSSTSWDMVKVIAGTTTSVDSLATSFSAGAMTTLTVQRSAGDNFEWWVNGVSQGVTQVTDAALQGANLPNGVGFVGLRASNNHNATGYHVERLTAWQ